MEKIIAAKVASERPNCYFFDAGRQQKVSTDTILYAYLTITDEQKNLQGVNCKGQTNI